ncbi:DUF4129 domain-containing protein [Flavobacteriaceae bacterium Ap0902]|nr:DUF4129 domain-containing protein [Flavobacteriaceae bacterium Ap0902]
MKHKFLIILFLSLCTAAQDTLQSPPPVVGIKPEMVEDYPLKDNVETADLIDSLRYISTATHQRSFQSNLKEKYSSPDFEYSMTKPRESLWDRIMRVLRDFLSDIFDVRDASNLNQMTEWVMKALAAVIIGLVLYWAIKFLIGKEGNFFFSKKNKKINPEPQTIKENIHEIDFNQLIAEYETSKNYRYAVRYQYLHLLKILTDSGLIEWDPDKTNLDYIQELAGRKEQTAFKKLSHIFDYVWYGEFDIVQRDYNQVKLSFNALKNRDNE